MRVIQLSTSSSGGAGIAASRLTTLLAQDGIETKLITRKFARKTMNPFTGLTSKTLGKIVTYYQRWISVSGQDLVTPLSVGQISLKEIYDFKPDIVHIHNWYNLLSISDLKRLGERFPVVFTLHDERLLTGGCHMTLGCQRFLEGCKDCPAVSRSKSLIAKKKDELALVLKEIPKYGVISPSIWLFNQALESHLVSAGRPAEVIPNTISSFETADQKKYSSEPSRRVKLLFVAADLSAHVKDFQLAIESVANLSANQPAGMKIELHVVGSNFPSTLVQHNGLNIKIHGYLPEVALSDLMLQVDALLLTSQSENSPNIIAEAQRRGLLVIARDAGGVSELVVDGETGFLTGSTVASIVEGIQRFMKHDNKQSLSDKALIFSNRYWHRDRILAKHKDLYSLMLRVR